MPPTFRELGTRGKVVAIGCSALLVAGLAAGTVVIASGSSGPPPSSETETQSSTTQGAESGGGGGSSASSPLLPGETTWSRGAPSYDFGFNNGIEYQEPAFSRLPSAQAQVKAAGLTIDRIWAPYEAVGATMDSGDITNLTDHINAAKASGAACYMEIGDVNNLAILEQEVTMAEPMGCHMFEFGNEVDGAHSNGIAGYTTQWNADIPALRALSVCAGPASVSTGCLFGGPTVMNASYNDDTGSGYSSGAAYWMAKLNKTNAFPDFVSWHSYPCNGAATWDSSTANDQADCLQAASSPAASCASTCNVSLPYAQSQMLGWEQQYLGKLLPTGISEYNFDPGSSTLSSWAGDSRFMYEWTKTVIDAFVASHFAFAMQFTALDYAGSGDLDMFSDSAPYAPKTQFYGMGASVKKYGGPSALAIPNPLP